MRATVLRILFLLPLLVAALGPVQAMPLPEDRPGDYVFDEAGKLSEGAISRISRKLAEFHQKNDTEIIVFVVNDPLAYDAVGTNPHVAMSRFAETIYETWQMRQPLEDWSFWSGLFRGWYEGKTFIAVVRADEPEVQLWTPSGYGKKITAFLYRMEAQGFQPGLDENDFDASISVGTDTLMNSVTENALWRDFKQWVFDIYHYALLFLFIAVPLGILYGCYRLLRRIWKRLSGNT